MSEIKVKPCKDAAVVIVHAKSNNSIVMVKSRKGGIGLPGGGIETKDNVGDGSNLVHNAYMAAIRELHEETGLDIRELKYISTEHVSYNTTDYTTHEPITINKNVYGFYVSIDAPIHPLSHNINENKASWISLEEFQNMDVYHAVNNVFIEKAIDQGLMVL